MKIYIVADLEGVSGVSGFDVYGDRLPGDVEKKRRAVDLWAGEVNAAIGGSLAAGAREILVLDNHGSGDNLQLDLLDPPAQLIQGRRRPTWLPLLDASVDALLFVGQHAKAGTQQGFLCHTYSRKHLQRILLNGREIGEIGLVAGIAGTHGVPTVFLSGDQRAADEAGDLVPGIESAAVKQGLSMHACLSLSCCEARQLIRARVESGLAKRASIAPLIFGGPFELLVDYKLSESWRIPARRMLRPRGDGRWAGIRRLKLTGPSLPPLWDRFVGIS